MPIVLYRVDERLIHGQVVVGWGTYLHPDRIIVVDDELAHSRWEQDLYALGLPPRLETEFQEVERARHLLPRWRDSDEKVLLLTRDLATMRRLAAGGVLAGEEVNIGGIHHAPGREPVLPYVFLSDSEWREIEQLAADRVRVTARDLPGTKRVELDPLFRDKRSAP